MSILAVSPLARGRYVSQVTYDAVRETSAPISRQKSTLNVLANSKKTKSAVTNIIIVLLIGIISFSGVLQMSSTNRANANFLTDFISNVFCGPEAYYFEPMSPNAQGLVPFGIGEPHMRKGGRTPTGGMTAYEKYGVSGTQFSMYRGTEIGMNKTENDWGIDRGEAKNAIKDDDSDPRGKGECFPIIGYIETGAANAIFEFTGIFTTIAIWVYGSAFNPTWVGDLNEAVADVIIGTGNEDGLRDVLYFQFLHIVLIFSALYLGWVGLAKRASLQAGQSAVWMIMAVLVGSLLLYSPKFLPDFANDIVTGVEEAILTGTTGVALGVSPMDNDANYCSVTKRGTSDRDMIIRQMECSLWSTFVYMPWVAGQYGTSTSDVQRIASDQGNRFDVTIGENTFSGNIALYQLDAQSMDYTTENTREARQAKVERWFSVADYLGEEKPTEFSSWAGAGSTGRIGVATLSLVASGFGLASVIVLSMLMLVYNLAMAMLIFVSVLFLLIGAHPGMGRGIALRWAEMVVGTILKRIMAAALLGILMAFYAIIMNNALPGGTGMSYGIALLAIIAISIATLGYRKTLTEAFSTVNFGGTQSGLEGGLSSGTKRAGAALGSAAISGIAAVGSGKAISSGIAAARRPGGGALRRVARGMAAGTKTAGSAAIAGGRMGALSKRMDGYAALEAYKQGSAEADSRTRGYIAQNAEEWDSLSPEARRRTNAEELKNIAKYRRDYEKYKDDEAWKTSFRKYYGIEPPNPETHDFYGYGTRRNPRTGKFDVRPATLIRERKREQDAPQLQPQPQPSGNQKPPTPRTRPRLITNEHPTEELGGGADPVVIVPPPSGGGGASSTGSGGGNDGPTGSGAAPRPANHTPSGSGSALEPVQEQAPRRERPLTAMKEYERRKEEFEKKYQEFRNMKIGKDGSTQRQAWERKRDELERERQAVRALRDQVDASIKSSSKKLPPRPQAKG